MLLADGSILLEISSPEPDILSSNDKAEVEQLRQLYGSHDNHPTLVLLVSTRVHFLYNYDVTIGHTPQKKVYV